MAPGAGMIRCIKTTLKQKPGVGEDITIALATAVTQHFAKSIFFAGGHTNATPVDIGTIRVALKGRKFINPVVFSGKIPRVGIEAR
jgi:hypothetical protein